MKFRKALVMITSLLYCLTIFTACADNTGDIFDYDINTDTVYVDDSNKVTNTNATADTDFILSVLEKYSNADTVEERIRLSDAGLCYLLCTGDNLSDDELIEKVNTYVTTPEDGLLDNLFIDIVNKIDPIYPSDYTLKVSNVEHLSPDSEVGSEYVDAYKTYFDIIIDYTGSDADTDDYSIDDILVYSYSYSNGDVESSMGRHYMLSINGEWRMCNYLPNLITTVSV